MFYHISPLCPVLFLNIFCPYHNPSCLCTCHCFLISCPLSTYNNSPKSRSLSYLLPIISCSPFIIVQDVDYTSFIRYLGLFFHLFRWFHTLDCSWMEPWILHLFSSFNTHVVIAIFKIILASFWINRNLLYFSLILNKPEFTIFKNYL